MLHQNGFFFMEIGYKYCRAPLMKYCSSYHGLTKKNSCNSIRKPIFESALRESDLQNITFLVTV